MPARAAPETHLRTLDVSKLTPRTRPEHLRTLPLSPHVQTCEAEASRTVQKLGILRNSESLARYQKTKFASLSGMWFPSAQLEVVQVCTDINWWVATFDDRIDGDLMQGTAAVVVVNCVRESYEGCFKKLNSLLHCNFYRERCYGRHCTSFSHPASCCGILRIFWSTLPCHRPGRPACALCSAMREVLVRLVRVFT